VPNHYPMASRVTQEMREIKGFLDVTLFWTWPPRAQSAIVITRTAGAVARGGQEPTIRRAPATMSSTWGRIAHSSDGS
jgi:hypothetical protein